VIKKLIVRQLYIIYLPRFYLCARAMDLRFQPCIIGEFVVIWSRCTNLLLGKWSKLYF